MITSTSTLNIPPPLPPNPGFLGDPPCLAEFFFSPLRTELVTLPIRSPAVQAAFEAMVVTMLRLGLRQRIRFPLRTGTELLIFCLQELLFVGRYNKLMLGVANTATVHSHPKGPTDQICGSGPIAEKNNLPSTKAATSRSSKLTGFCEQPAQ